MTHQSLRTCACVTAGRSASPPSPPPPAFSSSARFALSSAWSWWGMLSRRLAAREGRPAGKRGPHGIGGVIVVAVRWASSRVNHITACFGQWNACADVNAVKKHAWQHEAAAPLTVHHGGRLLFRTRKPLRNLVEAGHVALQVALAGFQLGAGGGHDALYNFFDAVAVQAVVAQVQARHLQRKRKNTSVIIVPIPAVMPYNAVAVHSTCSQPAMTSTHKNMLCFAHQAAHLCVNGQRLSQCRCAPQAQAAVRHVGVVVQQLVQHLRGRKQSKVQISNKATFHVFLNKATGDCSPDQGLCLSWLVCMRSVCFPSQTSLCNALLHQDTIETHCNEKNDKQTRYQAV